MKDYTKRSHEISKLPSPEREQECAKWMLEEDIWDTLVPKAPPFRPSEVLDYERLLKSGKVKATDDIIEHYEEARKIKAWNWGKLEALKELQQHTTNKDDYEKYRVKIAELKRSVG